MESGVLPRHSQKDELERKFDRKLPDMWGTSRPVRLRCRDEREESTALVTEAERDVPALRTGSVTRERDVIPFHSSRNSTKCTHASIDSTQCSETADDKDLLIYLTK